MKKLLILAVAFTLILPCFALAQLRVLVVDPADNTVIDNFLQGLQVSSVPPVLTLKLRNSVALPSSPTTCPQAKITISAKVFDSAGNLVKDWGVLGTMAITPGASVAPLPAPVSSAPIPAPVPSPTARPTGPFPGCWWGPTPADSSELLSYIEGGGPDLDPWENWLKAHPEDLQWAWSEYKKTNP